MVDDPLGADARHLARMVTDYWRGRTANWKTSLEEFERVTSVDSLRAALEDPDPPRQAIHPGHDGGVGGAVAGPVHGPVDRPFVEPENEPFAWTFLGLQVLLSKPLPLDRPVEDRRRRARKILVVARLAMDPDLEWSGRLLNDAEEDEAFLPRSLAFAELSEPERRRWFEHVRWALEVTTVAPPARGPLTDRGRAVLEILCDLAESEGRTACELAKALTDRGLITSEKSVRGSIRDELLPYGLQNRRGGIGYFIPPADRTVPADAGTFEGHWRDI